MDFQLKSLPIDGAYLLATPVFKDQRGSFKIFWEDALINSDKLKFKPDNANFSYNKKCNTIRAFHFQKSPFWQSKLVTCVSGKVWDVMVDFRPDSPTYKQWHATELEASDGNSVYLPAGCAHGFVTLEKNTTVAYLIEGEYKPKYSTVFNWQDPEIKVDWPIHDPVLSDKDANAPLFSECEF